LIVQHEERRYNQSLDQSVAAPFGGIIARIPPKKNTVRRPAHPLGTSVNTYRIDTRQLEIGTDKEDVARAKSKRSHVYESSYPRDAGTGALGGKEQPPEFKLDPIAPCSTLASPFDTSTPIHDSVTPSTSYPRHVRRIHLVRVQPHPDHRPVPRRRILAFRVTPPIPQHSRQPVTMEERLQDWRNGQTAQITTDVPRRGRPGRRV